MENFQTSFARHAHSLQVHLYVRHTYDCTSISETASVAPNVVNWDIYFCQSSECLALKEEGGYLLEPF